MNGGVVMLLSLRLTFTVNHAWNTPITRNPHTKKSIRRAAFTALLAETPTTAAAAPAVVCIEYVGGGKWGHGMTSSRVLSNYHHSTVCHGSTAVGTCPSRASAPAHSWPYASAPRAGRNNQTYWRNSCRNNFPNTDQNRKDRH
jgi:lactococcin 972 family bacteriocin